MSTKFIVYPINSSDNTPTNGNTLCSSVVSNSNQKPEKPNGCVCNNTVLYGSNPGWGVVSGIGINPQIYGCR